MRIERIYRPVSPSLSVCVPTQLVSRYARYEFTSRAVGATNLDVLPVPSRCAGHPSHRYCYWPYSPTLGHTGSDFGALGCDQDYSGLITKVTFWLYHFTSDPVG